MLRLVSALLALAALTRAADKCGVDLAFVMDESESVGEVNWPIVKNFVHDTAAKVASRLGAEISEDGTRVALVPFNDLADVALYLDESTSQNALKNALDVLSFHPGLTNIADGLEKTRMQVLQKERGDRAAVPNIVILVTDGFYTEGTEDPVAAAQRLRQAGATVIAVGVEGLNGGADATFKEELVRIAGSPENVFTVHSFDGLFGLVDSIAAYVPACRQRSA